MWAWFLRLIAPSFATKSLAGLVETAKVIVVITALGFGLWWLRYDAARDATSRTNAECAHTISKIETMQREEADRRADDAQHAGEVLPATPTGNRRELERLCRSDESCRARANAR